MNMFTYTAAPSVDMAAGTIRLAECTGGPADDVLQRTIDDFTSLVVNTRETAIREALIKLGWTPPPSAPRAAEPRAMPDQHATTRARADDPLTSITAAERATEFAGSHRERIMSALGWGELSSRQIARRAGLTVVQVDRRLPELRRDGVVEVVMAGELELERDGYRVWRRTPRN